MDSTSLTLIKTNDTFIFGNEITIVKSFVILHVKCSQQTVFLKPANDSVADLSPILDHTMTKPILYTMHVSPPCRAVELCAKALDLDLERKVVNLAAGDHLKLDFVKLNPQHTIPVLDDNGTVICESHAIMIYLVSKYGKDDSLYPKELVKQAKVNAALHFESGVLFARMRFVFEPIIFFDGSEIPADRAEYVQKAYQLLEDTLVDDYVVGNSLTIADLSCVSTVSSIVGVIPMDKNRYPKIHAWLERLKQLPYYEEANGGGAVEIAKFVLSQKEKNAQKA